MSCEIRLSARLQDTEAIRRYLFPTDNHRGGETWLQSSKLSVSPTGHLIALANERRLVVLTSKWDSEEGISDFHITFSETIHDYDKIKAILCIPVVGENHSTHVGPDWTCILIGYDSGYVRFYTENGDLLFEEQFHNENITSISCQSQHSPRPDISPELHPEEIYIHYQSNVSIISGYQLFTNLRNCRTQLARVQAKGNLLDCQQLPLNIKKLGFSDHNIINDVAVVGLNLSNTFDHLLVASNCGGFEAKYRSTPPNSTLVLAAGSKPFLGYHYVLEGVNQPVLGDVAKAVANKLKSALPIWLTGNKNQSEKEISASMQPIESMAYRFGLGDLQRTAQEIILSPNRKILAITDSLGRVILVDSFRGVALKIFKGYRDAQCSFIQVPDERKSKHRLGNKVGHFLIIYAPKKGTLEIFCVQQGTKVATFSASRFSKLVNITHGLMGFTATSKSKYICQFTCVFIDNDGQIKEILIPFHFALNRRNNVRARDIHLYKKLKQIIKHDCDDENLDNKICNVCSELKTVEIKQQVLEMILGSKQITAQVMYKCVELFLKNFEETAENSEKNENENSFKLLCQNTRKLLNLYLFLTNYDTSNDANHSVSPLLELEETDLEKFQQLLHLATSNDKNILKAPCVRFSGEIDFLAADFNLGFDLYKPNGIGLKTSLDESIKFKIAEVFFNPDVIKSLKDFNGFQNEILQSTISLTDLFDLLIYYWVNRELNINMNIKNDMSDFLMLILTLIKCSDEELVRIEYNSISPFWERIREILQNSSRPFPALMAAILFKTVAKQHELETSEYGNIEVLSQENIKWSLLIGRLEDVSILNIILANKFLNKDPPVLPRLKYEKKEISLKHVLQGGKGSVSELVAQWLTSGGIDPENIVINEHIFNNNCDNDKFVKDISLDRIDQVKSDQTFTQLNLLKKHFPYSLEASSLLANMCWEYVLAWRDNIKCMENLEAAIKCLNWVTNISISVGLHQLLWNTHLKLVVESASKLINKVGRLPKERVCQQDTGLTDQQVTVFINICVDFLKSFMDVCEAEAEDDSVKVNLKFEDIWENGGNQPLVELAYQQKCADYSLLDLHYQLLLVLQMIATFSIKHSKPINNLFETSTVNLLFTDLQKNVQINWNKCDIKTNSSRIQFLCKIISASLELVTLDEEGKIHCKEHVNWMEQCLTLARKWNLDVDKLKRYQIVQLYINSFDLVAEELISAVSDTNELGSELLTVAGRRLSQFLVVSPNLSQNITALSPALSKYLEQFKDSWCSPSSVAFIKMLAARILHCLDEDHKDYKLAELLLEACSTLEEIHT